MKLHYQNVNTNKLHDELIAAGIVPTLVESKGSDTWITTDTSKQMVDAVVSQHDPTPLPEPASAEQRIKDLEEAIALLYLEVSK